MDRAFKFSGSQVSFKREWDRATIRMFYVEGFYRSQVLKHPTMRFGIYAVSIAECILPEIFSNNIGSLGFMH